MTARTLNKAAPHVRDTRVIFWMEKQELDKLLIVERFFIRFKENFHCVLLYRFPVKIINLQCVYDNKTSIHFFYIMYKKFI